MRCTVPAPVCLADTAGVGLTGLAVWIIRQMWADCGLVPTVVAVVGRVPSLVMRVIVSARFALEP